MARKLRIEWAGAGYHVLNRGDRRELIFKDDRDRTTFVEALAAVCARISCLGNTASRRTVRPGAKTIRRGWCRGGEAFRKELLEGMSERRGAEHYDAERAESDTAKAGEDGDDRGVDCGAIASVQPELREPAAAAGRRGEGELSIARPDPTDSPNLISRFMRLMLG